MSKEFEKILSEIGEVKKKISDIDVIREKVFQIDEIKEKISDIDVIREKVSQIDEIKEKISDIDVIREKVSQIDGIKETLDVVKGSVVKIEDKINRELPALYEVYDLNYKLQKEKEKKIDSLENISDNLTYRVNNLENIAKEHSKMLKKLIS